VLAHKLLRGAQAGLYLPFALSRLRALHALSPNGSLAQRFRIGGYDILVRQTGPFQYISIIESGGSFFEFFTNGWPATTTSVSSEFGTFDYTDTMVVDTTIVDGKVSPIISLGKRNTSTHDASAINRGNQVQLIDEPVTYFPIKDGKYR
jgi:hypothetical protein